MTNRKKKLLIIQTALFLAGMIIIIFSYSSVSNKDGKIFDLKKKKEINKTIKKTTNDSDVFFNIKYSGLDLSGNRYILESEEAIINKDNQKLVLMSKVNANFYFKDNTILKVKSDFGTYNNETLDMNFKDNVKAVYNQSVLYAEKAEYFNSEGYLIITDQVKVLDPMGNLKADKLTFDVKNQKLNIDTLNNDKINANINLK
jgi:lipopolysaccharide export system protein LptA